MTIRLPHAPLLFISLLGLIGLNATAVAGPTPFISIELDNSISTDDGKLLHFGSKIGDRSAIGRIQTELPYRLSEMQQQFSDLDNWCQIIFLHLNVKACTFQEKPEARLSVYVGEKHYQSSKDANVLHYYYQMLNQTDGQLSVSLVSPEGPYGTENYQIHLKLEKLDESKTTLDLQYYYEFGRPARWAIDLYLGTIARHKKGFSTVSLSDNSTQQIGGMRGALERNVMRYYLAIVTHLHAEKSQTNLEQRWLHWYQLTSKYPQLYEVSETEYISNKFREYTQQRFMQELQQKQLL